MVPEGQVPSQLAAKLGRVVHLVVVACFGVIKDTQVAVELSSMVKERRAPRSRHVAEDSSRPLRGAIDTIWRSKNWVLFEPSGR